MRNKTILFAFLIIIVFFNNSSSQPLPLVFNVEHTAADFPAPTMYSMNQLPSIPYLPDPFLWADGRGRISYFSDWRYRRAEIGAQILHYEIGEKPSRPDSITANYSNGVLTVIVTVNGKTLTLTSQVSLPTGTGPFPAIIGMNSPNGSLPADIFTSRNIARITYNHNQVTTYNNHQNTDPYYQLYPRLNTVNTGQYSAWAWGVSRLIDGLELVQDVLPIDLKRIAVTGCSYAGKMALFAGAFDERIALTISQESGGGGYTTWRFSETLEGVEKLAATNYSWFRDSLRNFSSAVSKLPIDHHQLMAMVAPRALLVLGNPDYVWMADESGHVGSNAAKKVWEALGIPDRFGYSIVGGHSHCVLPTVQRPEVEAFVDKFLLGINTANTNIAITPYNTNLTPWITWTTPTLTEGVSNIKWTAQIYPVNIQENLDTTIVFKWKKTQGVEKYYIQVSLDPSFASVNLSDSTEIDTDTTKTITGLLKGKQYYWRVNVKSGDDLCLWSNVWNFKTWAPLPGKPELASANPLFSNRADWIVLKWYKTNYVDQYRIQIATDEAFGSLKNDTKTTDTVINIGGHTKGRVYYWRVQAIGFAGSGPWSDIWSYTANVTTVKENGKPLTFLLEQNYPNPFNPSTVISYQLSSVSDVKLSVYDMFGREVAVLVNEQKPAGNYEVKFDASHLSSGIYFYKLQAGALTSVKKLALLK